MNLTYEDSMDDLAESWVGAGLGALSTLIRMSRSRSGRTQAGWRGPLGMRKTSEG